MSKMYLIIMSDSNEYKKTKGVNKNVVSKISHNEFKKIFFFFNKNCLRHSLNSVQSKNDRIGTYETTKFLCLALMT